MSMRPNSVRFGADPPPNRAARKATASMRKPKEPGRSRADILTAATREFAARGYSGARVDAIAARTRCTRAMIYYYFGSKERLYVAVLEDAYRGIREAEKDLDLVHVSPLEAVRRLVAFTFDYYQRHPAFVALVNAENQAGGRQIRKARFMRDLNISIIDTIREVLRRGAREGSLRPGIDATDLHMLIASLGWFQISNRHSFGYLFKRDLASPSQVAHNRQLIIDTIVRFVSLHAGPASRESPCLVS
jgi:AcrR family transcriptional regulator